MNFNRTLIFVSEFLAVTVLSLCGSVSFSSSGIYAGFERSFNRILPGGYLSLAIFLILLVAGVFIILVRNKGGGFLAITVTVLSLPSIFSFNNIDLLKIFGGTVQITTKLTLTQMISIGCLIITAYLFLDLVNQTKLNYRRSVNRGASLSDVTDVAQRRHLISILLAGGALLVSLFILAISRGAEYFISKTSLPVSWWIVPVALFCIFVLGIYLYWFATRKNI